MNLVSRLTREVFTVSRFTLIGLLATATHAGVGAAAVFAGMPPFYANVVGFLVAWCVSFSGHYVFTFGRPGDIRVVGARFIVISVSLFVISQLTVALLQATGWVSDWLEPVIGAVIVPPASYILYRLYVFVPENQTANTARKPAYLMAWGLLRRLFWVHRILVPLALFALFFQLSILDPREIGWLPNGDMMQHFLGWTAFRHDDWYWPIGFSQLVAYPEGAPLTATDSNPLLAIPIKVMSPLLPDLIQLVGWWYLVCLLLSYNVTFNLLNYLSHRPMAALFATVITIAQSFFFLRFPHWTLMAHWLIFASLSVFIRPNSDRNAELKHAGINSLAIAIHPYFLPMTYAVAGMDVLRRSHRRLRDGFGVVSALRFLLSGVVIVTVPALFVGWILGIFMLETQPQPIGFYSMDPFAWFNGRDHSVVLSGWRMFEWQYEGAQYLGLGGLICLTVAVFVWVTGLSRPPERLRRALPWLLPAMIVLLILAVSPNVRTFGTQVASVDVSEWPTVAYVFSAFRSSGRFGWPIGYLIILTSVALLMTIRSRAVAPLLGVLAIVQLADISVVAEGTQSATTARPVEFRHLRNEQAWRQAVEGSSRVYASPGIENLVLLELGLMAFPERKSLNRFYYAQSLQTPEQKVAENREHDRVAAGRISDDVLYVLDPVTIGQMLRNGSPTLEQVRRLDDLRVIVPQPSGLSLTDRLPLHPREERETLTEMVEGCGVGCALLLSARDDAVSALPREFIDRLVERGASEIETLAFRESYAAIIVDGRLLDEGRSSDGDVSLEAAIFGYDVHVSSGGALGSNRTSIRVNGFEFSPDSRGFNVVRLQPEGVSAINAFDTHADAAKSMLDRR